MNHTVNLSPHGLPSLRSLAWRAAARVVRAVLAFGCLLALLGAFSGPAGSFDFTACVFLVPGITQKPAEDCSGSGSQCGAFAAFV